MGKYIKQGLILLFVVLSLVFYYENLAINTQKKYNTELKHITETQYSKQVADSLTNLEMRKIIRKLELDNIKKPKIVLVPKIEIKEIEKEVEKVEIKEGKIHVEDYYPNKDKPFLKYTLNDTTSTFKFFPIDLPIVLSENKDKTWSVDIKTPDFINITDIKANALPIHKEKARPFYMGVGVSKKIESYSYEYLGGIKVGRVLILGSLNTEKEVGVKTLYNF